jgi:hypothetical protein
MLILPAMQVNVRAGELVPVDDNGVGPSAHPLNVLGAAASEGV